MLKRKYMKMNNAKVAKQELIPLKIYECVEEELNFYHAMEKGKCMTYSKFVNKVKNKKIR